MKLTTTKISIVIAMIVLAIVALVFYQRTVVLGNYIETITNGINQNIDQESALNTSRYKNILNAQTIEKDLTVLGDTELLNLKTNEVINQGTIDTNKLQTVLLQASTINTGQGVTEVYLMDQNLRTIDSPTFANLTIDGTITVNNMICANCASIGNYVASMTTSTANDITITGSPATGWSPILAVTSILQTITGRGATSTNPITLNVTDGLDALVLSTSSVINLAQSSAPAITTDRLYNLAGNLTFNGVALTGGGGILPVGLDTYTLRHNGAGWVNATNLVNDGTNVGVGVAPSHKLHIVDSSTTASRAGLYVSQTGAIVGTGYAGYFSKTGASTTNVGGYFSASGATNNYGLIVENGNVGIGISTPANLLTVTAPTTADATTDVMIGTTAITQTGLVIQGVASQSANLQEWQNSAGVVMLRVSSTGKIVSDTGDVMVYDNLDVNNFRVKAGGTGSGVVMGSAYMRNDTGSYDLIINGWDYAQLVAQGGGNNGDIYVDGGTTSGTVVLGARTTAESTRMIDVLLHTKITNDAVASIGLVVKGAVAQSANLQEWLDSSDGVEAAISPEGIFASTNEAATLAAAATVIVATSNTMTITGDGGANTVATITGGLSGQVLTLIFVDGNVTITDTDAHTANTVDLSAAFTSADDTVIQLIFDGTSWYEINRSVN